MADREKEVPRKEPAGAPTVDMKLEVIVIPVSGLDRAKAFHGGSGGGSMSSSCTVTTSV